MSEERTIVGGFTMTWADQARCAMWPVIRAVVAYTVLLVVVLLVVWAMVSSDRGRLLPLSVLIGGVREAWPFFAGPFALVVVGLPGWYAWAFHRLSHCNRQLSYEATRDALTTRDAANFAFTVPWSSVIRVRNTEQVMRIRLASGGWRMIFWRAFTPEDREQVLNWARREAAL
jgi:hypothetical protein